MIMKCTDESERDIYFISLICKDIVEEHTPNDLVSSMKLMQELITSFAEKNNLDLSTKEDD